LTWEKRQGSAHTHAHTTHTHIYKYINTYVYMQGNFPHLTRAKCSTGMNAKINCGQKYGIWLVKITDPL